MRASLETYMVYPGAASQGKPYAQLPDDDRRRVHLALPDGTRIEAEFAGALDSLGRPATGSRPTVLYFYGNGACMARSEDIFQGFRRLGMNVLIADYPGFGLSGGSPTEAGLFATADALYAHACTLAEVDRGRIVAAGWSLGAAVAIDLASRKQVCALETLSAFTGLRATARHLFPWLPVSLLVRQSFDNASKIERVHCPISLVHGTEDDLVPVRMAEALRKRAGGPVRLLRIAGAGHNDVVALGGSGLWDFLREGVPAQ